MTQSCQLREPLLKADDHGLWVRGKVVRAAIHERIERSCQLKRRDVPQKLDPFDIALQDLPGKSARVMEKLLAKNLYSQLSLSFSEHESCRLVDYADDANAKRSGG